jgi:hypothetical protein
VKVYIVKYKDPHEWDAEPCTLGIFSTKEKAEEASEHSKVEEKSLYNIDNDYWIREEQVDEYWNRNCTKLHKVLK